MRALRAGLVALLVNFVTDVLDVLLAAGDEVHLLHVALNRDVEDVTHAIGGFASSLLDQESQRSDFVKK